MEPGGGTEETDVNTFRKRWNGFRKCFGGNSAGHVDRLDAGHERKGKIKDGSCIYDLSLWADGLAIYWDRKDQGISCIPKRGEQMKGIRYKEWKERKGTCHMYKLKCRKCKIRIQWSKQEFNSIGLEIVFMHNNMR